MAERAPEPGGGPPRRLRRIVIAVLIVISVLLARDFLAHKWGSAAPPSSGPTTSSR